MADIAPIPFINFGLSQAQQADAQASAGLKGQQTAVAAQQARSAQMAADLQQRAMPLYQQNIDDMIADMHGTAANSNAPTNEHMPSQQPGVDTQADASGVNSAGNATSATPPSYADSGAIAEHARQQNWVEPITQDEARRLKQGALMATMPGGNPTMFEQAKLQREYRVQMQTNAAQFRSGQTYDVMTAVADPNNDNPLGMLAATPGQQGVAARIAKDYQGDQDGAQNAARKYAQVTAFHTHQYTGNKTDMQNGVLVDTVKGAPVTGQDQVLTGLTPEQRDKYLQYAYEPIDVKFTDGTTQKMPRYAAPKEQGGFGGVTPSAMLAREDALARRHLNDPNQPDPGANTWAAPGAIGNTSAGKKAQASGQPTAVEYPNANQTGAAPAPGAKPAVGNNLKRINGTPGVGAASDVPSPSAPQGPAPQPGTPQYDSRMQAALQDPTYKAKYAPSNLPHIPGAPMPGVDEGVKQYQTQAAELRQYGGQMSDAAGKSLLNLQAAKAILQNVNNGLPLSGPIGAMAQKVAATLGVDINTASGRVEVGKYLTNFAVSSLKDTYGSRPAAFDVKINLEQAFPNVKEMSAGPLNDLIDSQIAQAKYLKASSERAVAYGQRGLEPNSFPTWNERYFPREDTQVVKSASAMETRAKGAWGAYEPDKYEYRDSNGKLQRRAKQ